MSELGRTVRLVYPHQLFEAHLEAGRGTHFVFVEDDLFFRQYRFHSHKLVLHRASMRAFADRLREHEYHVTVLESVAGITSTARLAGSIDRLRPSRVEVYDVVDDWLSQRITGALADAGHRLTGDEVLETPNFLTTRASIATLSAGRTRRMHHFYTWQRRRLGILMDGNEPIGGQWSYDQDNRKRLPRGHVAPDPVWPEQNAHVRAAIDWVREHFPGAPGDPETFAWPTTHAEAEAGLEQFLVERFGLFGPYEDAISHTQPFVYHSLLT
ncbi:MAG: cryptochrome/photolyase family protein, partial [Nocardioides sp.]